MRLVFPLFPLILRIAISISAVWYLHFLINSELYIHTEFDIAGVGNRIFGVCTK